MFHQGVLTALTFAFLYYLGLTVFEGAQCIVTREGGITVPMTITAFMGSTIVLSLTGCNGVGPLHKKNS